MCGLILVDHCMAVGWRKMNQELLHHSIFRACDDFYHHFLESFIENQMFTFISELIQNSGRYITAIYGTDHCVWTSHAACLPSPLCHPNVSTICCFL